MAFGIGSRNIFPKSVSFSVPCLSSHFLTRPREDEGKGVSSHIETLPAQGNPSQAIYRDSIQSFHRRILFPLALCRSVLYHSHMEDRMLLLSHLGCTLDKHSLQRIGYQDFIKVEVK